MNRQLLYIKVVGSRGRWQKIRIIHGPKSFVLCQRRCSIVNVSIWPLVDASASLAFLIWSGSLCRVDGSWGLVAVDDRLERCGNRCGSHRWLSWKKEESDQGREVFGQPCTHSNGTSPERVIEVLVKENTPDGASRFCSLSKGNSN